MRWKKQGKGRKILQLLGLNVRMFAAGFGSLGENHAIVVISTHSESSLTNNNSTPFYLDVFHPSLSLSPKLTNWW